MTDTADRKGNEMSKLYRQGDVLLERVRSVPKDAKKLERDGRVVLAYGEVTGHAHIITDEECDVFEATDAKFYAVLASGGVDLTHEEHATITLPEGIYRQRQQREYSPEAIRNVAD